MKGVMIALNQRPIAYYRIYRDMTKSTTAGILVSQLMYWWSAVNGKEFYKTDEEIMEETGLSAGELKSAKVAVKKLDFIGIKLRGVPARTFYSIDDEKLALAIQAQMKENDAQKLEKAKKKAEKQETRQFGQFDESSLADLTKLDSSNQLGKFCEFDDCNTESTQESTTKNTSKRGEVAAPRSLFPVEEKMGKSLPGHYPTDLINNLSEKQKKWFQDVYQIGQYFVEATGKERYNAFIKPRVKAVVYWLEKGHTVEDFKLVIQFKTKQFLELDAKEPGKFKGNIDLQTYLRQDKFERNLEQAREASAEDAVKIEVNAESIEIEDYWAQYWDFSNGEDLEELAPKKEKFIKFYIGKMGSDTMKAMSSEDRLDLLWKNTERLWSERKFNESSNFDVLEQAIWLR